MRCLVPFVLLLAMVFAAPAWADSEPLPLPGAVQLSDEQTLSRWAHPVSRSVVRAQPEDTAKTVGRLRYFTEDRRPEVYLALQSWTDPAERTWVQIRLPKRPNGTVGWVRREALGSYHRVSGRIVINRATRRLTLIRGGRVRFTARIGVGAKRTPTPAGQFYIRERVANLGGSPIYGPLAFGTSAYSVLSDWPKGGVIGIHGTNQPGLLPGAVSHGCVRLANRDILRLAKLARVGMPVEIR